MHKTGILLNFWSTVGNTFDFPSGVYSKLANVSVCCYGIEEIKNIYYKLVNVLKHLRGNVSSNVASRIICEIFNIEARGLAGFTL